MKHTKAIRRRQIRTAVAIDALEPRRLLHGDFDVTFNFQPVNTPLAPNTVPDYGYTYGDRGNGYKYGWNVDSRNIMRDRNKTSDQRLDTVAQLQQNGERHVWELEIPNGQYEVTITSGDSQYLDGQHHVDAEGTRVMYGVQTSTKRYLTATKIIEVKDGRLTISPESSGVNSKVISVDVESYHAAATTLPTVSVVASDGSANEDGDQGEYTLTRSSTSGSLTVNWTWSSLATGADYQIGRVTSSGTTFSSRPNSITFDNGVGEIKLRLRPVNDTIVEGNEHATLNLSASSAYTVSSTAAKAEILITDNDGTTTPTKPVVTVTASDASATEGGDTAAIKLARTGDLSQSITVPLTWSGSAGSGDFNRPGSATFAAGNSTATITLTATDDAIVESDESATVTLGSGTGYTLGSPASASILIHDNDVAPPTTDSFKNINWSTTSSPPVVFSETTSITVNNKLYLFGGFNGVFQPQKNVYRFDGQSWVRLADSPVAFTHVGATEVDGKIWFAGGYLGKSPSGQIFGTTDVRIYDPANDTWSMGPALPSARAAGNLVQVGRKLYFFGGELLNRTGDSTTMWSLDLDNQGAGWQGRASMPLARNHASAVEVNGKIYVLAGQTGYDNSTVAHNDIQIYDPASNSWTVASQKLPGNRSHTVSATQYYGGKILIVGGQSGYNQQVNTVWAVDPSTLVTTALNSFPDSRFSIATGIVNGKVYAIGGYKGQIATQGYVGTFI